MKILQTAKAGTLESGDILITVSKGETDKLIIKLETPVEALYGETIKKEILEIAESLEVKNAIIHAIDKGALHYTVTARTETALLRVRSIPGSELTDHRSTLYHPCASQWHYREAAASGI